MPKQASNLRQIKKMDAVELAAFLTEVANSDPSKYIDYNEYLTRNDISLIPTGRKVRATIYIATVDGNIVDLVEQDIILLPEDKRYGTAFVSFYNIDKCKIESVLRKYIKIEEWYPDEKSI